MSPDQTALINALAEMHAAQTKEIISRVARVEDLVIEMKSSGAATEARVTAVENVAAGAAETAGNAHIEVRQLRNYSRAIAAAFTGVATIMGTYLKFRK